MKPCPSCGYGNPDTGVKCAICGKDVSRVPVKAERPPEKESRLMIAAGLLLLCCGAAFFFLQRVTGTDPAPASVKTAFSEEAAFDYSGVLDSLSELGKLRFLPAADKARILPLAASPDDRVGRAAVRLLGSWAREEKDPAAAAVWFEALLKTAASGRTIARTQAAFEAGACAAEGFAFKPYLPEIRQIAAGLIAENDEHLKSSGFFLAGMAGLDDFAVQLRGAFELYPAGAPKLYASCALARLGDGEGLKYLVDLSSQAGDLRAEAESCLGYAAAIDMPRPERLPLFPRPALPGQKNR